jgi:ankyrin repeat protein
MLPVIDVLLQRGANVDAKDRDGRTALAHLSSQGWGNDTRPICNELKLKLVERLVAARADTEVVDADGNTPLMIAARNPNTTELLTVLLRAGANVTATNRHGLTAQQVALTRGHGESAELLGRARRAAAELAIESLRCVS